MALVLCLQNKDEPPKPIKVINIQGGTHTAPQSNHPYFQTSQSQIDSYRNIRYQGDSIFYKDNKTLLKAKYGKKRASSSKVTDEDIREMIDGEVENKLDK